jgi:succinate dehydrogenase / fumarate reductase flavoprotein subunit
MWLDDKNQYDVTYRDVHMNTLSNEIESIPPVARVY